jgi:hypothetical protein
MRPNGLLVIFFFGAVGFLLDRLPDALVGSLGSYLGPCLLLALFALGLILRGLEPLARKRGWGSEGRLTRYLSRPRFIDEARRLRIDLQQGP